MIISQGQKVTQPAPETKKNNSNNNGNGNGNGKEKEKKQKNKWPKESLSPWSFFIKIVLYILILVVSRQRYNF